jgi:hypothetical protein
MFVEFYASLVIILLFVLGTQPVTTFFFGLFSGALTN